MSVEAKQTCSDCKILNPVTKCCSMWCDVCEPVPCKHQYPLCWKGCEGLTVSLKTTRDQVRDTADLTSKLVKDWLAEGAENHVNLKACSFFQVK